MKNGGNLEGLPPFFCWGNSRSKYDPTDAWFMVGVWLVGSDKSSNWKLVVFLTQDV